MKVFAIINQEGRIIHALNSTIAGMSAGGVYLDVIPRVIAIVASIIAIYISIKMFKKQSRLYDAKTDEKIAHTRQMNADSKLKEQEIVLNQLRILEPAAEKKVDPNI